MVRLRERGFTLTELVVVLLIAGTIAAIAGPRFADGLRQRSVAAAADQFVLAHSLARSTALRYGRVAELHIVPAATRFWVEVDTSGSGKRDTVGLLHDLAQGGLHMTSTRSLLCFDARGMATETGKACQPGDASVVFALAARADTVRVTTLGKVLR